MTTLNPVIEVEGLSFGYERSEPLLEGATFTVDQGDFTSIIGPNGGGKTTLVKLLLGLLKPRTGTIKVLGTSPEKARPRIGVMPQNPSNDPLFPVRAIDVVMMGCLRPGRSLRARARRHHDHAVQALEKVGLSGIERRAFSALSGGQKQRVLLARAIAPEPELLMLDEPEAGLDRKVEQDFFDLLEQINKDTTVVLVSHDLGFVSSFVRTVICVHRTVDVHPTTNLDGAMIRDLYGGDVRMVRHDRCV